ncbi:MAG: T9SS type A sorting domain-containing protein [Fibrobacteria bacterium]|nr:T9SS type A sorting domain-containing protein [Fibrobacteria bacterium]
MKIKIKFGLILLALSCFSYGDYTVLSDSLSNGKTLGTQNLGSFSEEGYMPKKKKGNIFYEVPYTVRNGYIEFEVKGMDHNEVISNGDHGFMGMYDGRGFVEPARYTEDFKHNFFRWNVHWRQNRSGLKCVLVLAEEDPQMLEAELAVQNPRDWYEEPDGQNVNWDPAKWHKFRVEWKNKEYQVMVDSVKKWGLTGPYDYAPVKQVLWLGSAPGYEIKYRNLVPGITYRNFKLVDFDSTATDTTPLAIVDYNPSGLVLNATNELGKAINFQYYLPSASLIHLDVYNMSGNRIRRLVSGEQKSGWHTFNWQGNKNGKLEKGVYFINLDTGSGSVCRKISVF